MTLPSNGPLSGLMVVDLTQVLAGPFSTMLLADMGADVVKVEPPAGDVSRQWGPYVATFGNAHPESPAAGSYGGYFASVNRNKRSVCLDLKTEADRACLLELLGDADVLVENFRVGVMERFGLSYPTLHERFPRLVYASIRGFGDPLTGASPYADWPAFDIIAQAMGGIMSVTGTDREHPVKVGPGIGDIFPGALAAFGVLAAVRHAERTGVGQLVDIHPLLCPYGAVRTADGFVALATPSDHHWCLLATAIGQAALGQDPRFASNAVRLQNAAQVYATIEEWSAARPTAMVIAALGGLVPCAPVNTAADIAVDPHVAARQMIVRVPHPEGGEIDIVGTPLKLTETPARRFERAPLLGEHTGEVLGRLTNGRSGHA
jgi:crotonobetainyl-CoA:carnitine CoA-transferase CaiB-like acyl-CoA transferase